MDDAIPADWGEARSREVTWFDPLIGAARAPEMTGIDYLRAIRDGELPPLVATATSTCLVFPVRG